MKKRTILFLTALISIGWGISLPASGQTQPEAGFISLEANNFYFHLNSYFNRIALRSSPARIWYVYQPADEDPESKPLFVFFNGGPGGATSAGLLAASTGRNAVIHEHSTGEASIISNPASWTRIGNLLHIDARTTGFSYSLMDNPGNDSLREGEFDAQNYNAFTDGADFVRVLLQFLAAHPSIQGNRVILVPESYGGIRTIVMLHFLLYYQNYADGQVIYQNPDLVRDIQTHYDVVFPDFAGQIVPQSVIAGQFSHQILIQTALSWANQRLVQVEMLEAPGSVLDQLAAETGVPYVRYRDQPGADPNPTPTEIRSYILSWLYDLGRDPYHYAMPTGYFNGFFEAAAGFLTQLDSLNLMIGVDAAGIEEMYASARSQAYKTKTVVESESTTRLSGREGSLRNGTRSAGKRSSPARTDSRRRTSPVRQSLPPPRLDLSALIGPGPDESELLASFLPLGEEELASIFGSLASWDRFFNDLNYDVGDAFAWNRATLREYNIHHNSTPLFGQMFLENAAWVETFATDAYYDMVVYTPSLPGALALHSTMLSASVHDTVGPPGAARPGQILLSYHPSSVPGSSVTTRTIRFPIYFQSGHAVTMTEPMEMLEDVIEWLESTGITARSR
jgi:hypothetical protein